jgi:hypothetical protein
MNGAKVNGERSSEEDIMNCIGSNGIKKIRLMAFAFGVFGLGAMSGPPAEAAPVLFGSNYYEFIRVSDPFTGNNNAWTTARDTAAGTTFMGVSGRLATITSQAENDFLFDLVSGNHTGFVGSWLGGKAPEGWLVGPEAGQAFSYTNWAGIEPNNDGYAYMSIGTEFAPGQWADDSDLAGQGVPHALNDPVIGFFIEYDNVIPEPATGLLALIGVAGLFVRRR